MAKPESELRAGGLRWKSSLVGGMAIAFPKNRVSIPSTSLVRNDEACLAVRVEGPVLSDSPRTHRRPCCHGYWKGAPLFDMACQHSIPDTIEMPPDSSQSAVEHARGISIEGSMELSGAFDNLRMARMEIEKIKNAGQVVPQYYQRGVDLVIQYLDSASLDLDKAQEHFTKEIRLGS